MSRFTFALAFLYLNINALSVPYLIYAADAKTSMPQENTNAQTEPSLEEAKEFIINLGKEATSLLTSKTISSKERKTRFKELFQAHFATKSIAKFCLGRYWRIATDEEKQKYIDLFDDSVADNYASKFSQYNPEDKFVISTARSLADGGIKVNSKLQTPDGAPINIVWLVYKKENSYKIFDVLLEGVSMSVTQRSEYASIIEKEGGKISGLILALQNKQPLKKQ